MLEIVVSIAIACVFFFVGLWIVEKLFR